MSESVAFNILANELAALIRAGARQQNEVQIFLRSRLGDLNPGPTHYECGEYSFVVRGRGASGGLLSTSGETQAQVRVCEEQRVVSHSNSVDIRGHRPATCNESQRQRSLE